MTRSPDSTAQVELIGRWKKADLNADVRRLVSELKSAPNGGLIAEKLKEEGKAGRLLLFATQLTFHGYAEEAKDIANRVFELAGGPEEALKQAQNFAADCQLMNAFQRFFAKQSDWQAYQREIGAILERFGNSWPQWAPAKLLAEMLKKRENPPAQPRSTIAKLTDEDFKLAVELADSQMESFSDTWILDALLTEEHGDGPRQGSKDTQAKGIKRIQQRGIRSIPLLIALMEDDYPATETQNSAIAGNHHHLGVDDGNDSVRRAFNGMPRPLARGELAWDLLDSAPPRREGWCGEVFRSDPKKAPSALFAQWYLENKDKSAGEIARLYLKSGNERQMLAAMTLLLKEKNEADLGEIEKRLLESASINIAAVREYVGAIGPRGIDFLERCKAFVKNNSDANNKPTLEELDLLQDSIQKSARQILDEVITGKRSWKSAEAVFKQTVEREEFSTTIGLYLEAIEAVRDLPTTASILEALETSHSTKVNENTLRSSVGIPLLNRKDDVIRWKKLLADNRVFGLETPCLAGNTVGFEAAACIERIYGNNREADLGLELGAEAFRCLVNRAEARLHGKACIDLPKLPSVADVSAERKKEIVTDLIATSEDALPRVLEKLSGSELLWLAREENAKIREKCLPLAHRVIEVHVEGVDQKTAQEIRQWKGKLLDRELWDAIVQTNVAVAKTGLKVICEAVRQGAAQGVIVFYGTRKMTDANAIEFGELNNEPDEVMACLIGDSISASGYWPSISNDERNADLKEEFFSELDDFFRGKRGVFTVQRITIGVMPPARKE